MENEYEKKLDSLLTYLLKNEIDISGKSFSVEYYENVIKESKLLDYEELLELSEILFEDKHINATFYYTPYDDSNIKVIQKVKISTKGKIFISRGGYEKRLIDQNRLNQEVRATSATLKRLNYILAFGALIASIYYLTELCKYYSWHFCFCH